ncbi:MAG: radical SAM family heme chaperone HemW [Anaerolineae bacterium]|nr:radical SAM family heme chaperone HemW [Anaerolineae bacterium]
MSHNEIALFVFTPFCKIKCTYCDFNAYAHLSRWMVPYTDAVIQEIRRSAACPERSRRVIGGRWSNVRSIYLGGGTPSLLPIECLEKILRACQSLISNLQSPSIEITIEANPGTADEDKLRALRALGVNRLSIGAQVFDDATLRRLNRGHTVADTLETYACARRVGFDNINLDLIYGLPFQTLDDLRTTLERALVLAPEHFSLYALKVEEGTGLAHQIARGKYPPPDDELMATMYETAEEMLDAAGYAQYEISNWARGEQRLEIRDSQSPIPNLQSPISNLQSQHNLTYWRNEPYLGFGAGAHSYLDGERFWNVASPLEYIQRIERGESVVAGRETISRELEMAETLLLGLRLNVGVAFADFYARFGEDARARYAQQFEQARALGLLEVTDERVRLTRRGRLLSNQVFWRLLP